MAAAVRVVLLGLHHPVTERQELRTQAAVAAVAVLVLLELLLVVPAVRALSSLHTSPPSPVRVVTPLRHRGETRSTSSPRAARLLVAVSALRIISS
jgi:hypothetical protein